MIVKVCDDDDDDDERGGDGGDNDYDVGGNDDDDDVDDDGDFIVLQSFMNHTFYEESITFYWNFQLESYGINSGWSFEADKRQFVQLYFKELSFI